MLGIPRRIAYGRDMATPSREPLTSPLLVAVDVMAYAYALVVVLATLHYDLAFAPWQAVAVVAVFLVMRVLARDLRRECHQEAVRVARSRARVAAASPARWSVEQRDGHGRRLDSRA